MLLPGPRWTWANTIPPCGIGQRSPNDKTYVAPASRTAGPVLAFSRRTRTQARVPVPHDSRRTALPFPTTALSFLFQPAPAGGRLGMTIFSFQTSSLTPAPHQASPPFFATKPARTLRHRRSSDMPIMKRLRLAFYVLATIELILVAIVSNAWGQLPPR